MNDVPSRQWRADLAERWARRLSETAYIPMGWQDIRERLRTLLDELVDALEEDLSRIDRIGRCVGAELVAMRANGADSLSGSLELLRDTVCQAAEDGPARRSHTLFSAIAAGFAAADRESTFEQQESLKRALLRSKLKADQERDITASRFREVFTSAPVGIALCDLSGRFLEVNPALVETLGYSADQLTGMTIHELFHPEDADYLTSAYEQLAEGSGPPRLWERRRFVDSDGTTVESYLAVSVLRDENGDPSQFVTMVEDISELHRLQESFHHQALHDVLTGLANRQFFRTRLETWLASLPKDASITLYHLGLNGFELVNDGLGYEVGDTLIKAVARTLERLTDEVGGMVARFGGTEFAILVRQTADSPNVAQFASRINEELSEPVYVGEHGIATSASIGVVQATVGTADTSDLIWAADVALRRAEAAGHRQWALFDPDRAPNERTEARLAAVIPGALELGDFRLRYQPIIAMRSGRLAALEVQLNWEPDNHPPLNHVRCLRLAERSGVTLSLRDWMLRSAWEKLESWHELGYRPRLAVGLSPHQTQDPDLVASVNRILQEGKLDPSYLWLSMPFGAVTGFREEARENVGYLHELGVRTSLHGFHASPEEFRHLRELPVHAVRLAPELVRLIHESESPESVEVQAVMRLIPLLSADDSWIVIGEVDSEEQAEIWCSMGGRGAAAGPLYGEPLEPDDVPALLESTTVVD